MFPYGLLYLPGLLRLVLVSYTLFLYILCMQVSGYAKCQTQSSSTEYFTWHLLSVYTIIGAVVYLTPCSMAS